MSAVYMRFVMYVVLVITFDNGDEMKKNELGGNLARQREVKNETYMPTNALLYVFLALQPIVVVFSTAQ